MATTTKKWTVNAIKDAMRAAGSHWFDPDTMRCFGTVVLPTVYQGPGGVYFVTKDDQYRRELPKRYTVRKYNPVDNDIDTVGELNAHATADDAKQEARRMAGRGLVKTTETFREVSNLDQFAHDLQKHSNPERGTETKTVEAAKELIHLAAMHHKYMEGQCNGEWPYANRTDDDRDEHPPVVRQCRGRVIILAGLFAAGVIFSGDPRGCTVKLTFKDGATNDFGKEGWCVPTEL